MLLPADQFVLKVHSRCDLACDHCYVYESADQSWRGRPKAIPSSVVTQAAARIAEHAKTHELSRVEVILHGGEPLLCGISGLRAILVALEEAVRGLCQLDVKVQTNGVLLSQEFCELFDEHGVEVGISIDGDKAANDRHRRYRDGRSSYDPVVRAIRLLSGDRFRHLFAGLLCTIDTANDPVRVYESLLDLDPPRLDLLLPHATWDVPPPRSAGGGTEYADWLIAIFDRWQADGCPVRIRTFDSIIDTLADGRSGTEAYGLAPVRMVVIETDGSYEQADSLKVAFDGAPATGLDVFTHSLDSVLEHPGITARQQGVDDLSATCRRCPVVRSCGGGMYAHRYRSGSDFDNPSVYCADLLKLIGHIADRMPHVTAAVVSAGHAVSDDTLTRLATGLGGPEDVGQLAQAQRSVSRGLLAAVYQAGIASPAVSAPARNQLRAAWRVLAMADSDQPEAFNTVLGHPYLRAWAVHCLERLGSAAAASPDSGRSLAADLGHLGAIAAAVAIRGQARASLTLPVADSAVYLPGLGRLTIAPSAVLAAGDEGQAGLEVDADWVRVRSGADHWRLSRPHLLAGQDFPAEPCTSEGTFAAGAGPEASWEPVRTLTAAGLQVALDDTDPYRDDGQRPAAPRLSHGEFDRWQNAFTLAWHEIQEHHAAYAPALATGLVTLTPLVPAGSADSDGAEAGFGAIRSVLPDSPVTLALLFLREFQLVKLGAVLDLYDLCDPADERLYRTPWHQGLCPAGDLLRDAFVHLAVTGFWRGRAELGQDDQAEAAQRYEDGRMRVAAAAKTLADSGALTPLGLRFTEQMRNAPAATDLFV